MDKEQVVKIAQRYKAAVAKHFPGHGDTDSDSHIKLPVIDVDFETFKKRELVPFIYLIKENIPAVMSGHLSFPKIDSSGAPASLSKYFLTDLLRGELGYKGRYDDERRYALCRLSFKRIPNGY